MTADLFYFLPQCDAVVVKTKVDLFGSPVMEETGDCGLKATIFYLVDGKIECRCISHPLDPYEYRDQMELSWDEYQVALIMVS